MKKNIQFEWDENKRLINIEKHKLDFIDAKEVFKNKMVERVINDSKHGEERRIGLGFVQKIIFTLVYTLRDQKVRLISFRKASRKERELYDKETKKSD